MMSEDLFSRGAFLMVLGERKSGYKYYEIALSLRNGVGALHSIIAKLAEAQINILAGLHTGIGEKVEWFSFIEVPESASIEQILGKISDMDVVLNVRYTEMKRTDYFDRFQFPLYVRDDRIMILTATTFHALKKAITDVLQSGGEAIIYLQGLLAGSQIYDQYPKELTSIEDKLLYTENLFRAFGWGLAKFYALDPKAKTGTIRIENSLEATESMEIKCHFMRGYLTGLLRKIFQDDSIKIKEVMCRATGEPHCEYHFL
ncbi:MAG: V4R domain-containing protein [Candidatus Bathyarchaeia archaeon]